MKLLSIGEVWAAEQAQGVRVPTAVASAARAALARFELEGGASLGSVARARELAKGVVGRPVVARIAAFFSERLEKSLDSVGAQLHGGPAGRAWAADIMKAAEEPDEDAPADPKSEHRDLRRRLSMIMAAHGDDGVPIATFKDHVDKHGHQAVARALRELGADHADGRVLTRRSRAPATVAAKPKPKPKPEPAAKPKAKPKAIAKAVVLAAPARSSWRPMRFWGQA
jgi:hypothetical protein